MTPDKFSDGREISIDQRHMGSTISASSDLTPTPQPVERRPPTFEERDFALDTTLKVSPGRTFFGIAKAVKIETPRETLRLGVPSGVWPQADVMILALGARRERAVAATAEQKKFLAKAEAMR